MALKIERLQSIDELIALYKITYPEKEYTKFDWLYFDNPRGEAEMYGLRNENDGKLIGAYVFIPMLIDIRGRKAIIGQAIDGMVLKEYRGKGVFNTLVTGTYQIFKDSFEYLFVYPDFKTRSAWIRTKWQELGEFVAWSFPLTVKALPDSLTGKPIIGPVVRLIGKPIISLYAKFYASKYRPSDKSLTTMTSVPENIDEINAAVQRASKIRLVRDKDFVKWRLLDIPRENYRHLVFSQGEKTLGYISYKIENNGAEIVDFIISPEQENQKAALSLFIDHCLENKFDSLHFQLAKHAYCAASLKNCGFIKRPSIDTVFIYPTDESRETIDYSECYFSVADTDWI